MPRVRYIHWLKYPIRRCLSMHHCEVCNKAFKLQECHIHGSEFTHLWDSINSKRAPWSSNPFVWAISFRRAAQEGEKTT